LSVEWVGDHKSQLTTHPQGVPQVSIFETWEGAVFQRSPVPHPCAFFLAQGWETTKANSPPIHKGAPGLDFETWEGAAFTNDLPCPILAPFFWRKGGKPQKPNHHQHLHKAGARIGWRIVYRRTIHRSCQRQHRCPASIE